MNGDQQTTDADVSVEGPPEGSIFDHMQAETRRNQEFAEAFTRMQSEPLNPENLLEEQRKHADRITQLDRAVRRLRRSVVITNLLAGALLLAMMSAAGYFYFNPGLHLQLGREDADSNDRQVTRGSRAGIPELVLESETDFNIRTDTDRKYQQVIRELRYRLFALRRTTGPVEVRAAATEDYINFMTDLSRIIEQAAEDQPSPEIMTGLINFTIIAPQMRRVERLSELNVTMQNRLDQIQAVLRAGDVRSTNPEIRPIPYEG